MATSSIAFTVDTVKVKLPTSKRTKEKSHTYNRNKKERRQSIRKSISDLQQLVPGPTTKASVAMVAMRSIQYVTFLRTKVSSCGDD